MYTRSLQLVPPYSSESYSQYVAETGISNLAMADSDHIQFQQQHEPMVDTQHPRDRFL